MGIAYVFLAFLAGILITGAFMGAVILFGRAPRLFEERDRAFREVPRE